MFVLLRTVRRLRGMGGITAVVLSLALGCALASSAFAHSGHPHDLGDRADGRLPGQPDFQQIGNTTYRFNPGKEEYEILRPGRPTAFAHGDSALFEPAGTSAAGETALAGPGVELPTSELSPVCRTSGNRIVVVYTHRPTDGTPTPSSTIRSIIKRMNWKFNSQSSQSSGGSRALKMIVDCDAGGTINVYDVPAASNALSGIESAVHSALFGEPKEGNAVKYLVFDHETYGSVSGISAMYGDARKSSINSSAIQSAVSVIYNDGAWTRHVTLHELLHALGGTQWKGFLAGGGSTTAPYATAGHHCSDGLDVLCYNDGTEGSGSYSETRCSKASGYETPEAVPIDCGTDTYFDALPVAESWLDKYWNVAGYEDPFLAGPPKATTGSAAPVEANRTQVTGEVDPGGYDTTYQVQYGTTESYGSVFPSPAATAGGNVPEESASFWLEGLSPNTTYHYRMTATNSAGTSYGKDQQFKTGLMPSVTTGEATGIAAGEATLRGTVNPNGYATSYRFEWGLTTGYGNSVPIPNESIGSGTGNVAVEKKITGLKGQAVYHYRVSAENSKGKGVGPDKTFTTPDWRPTVTTEGATAVGVSAETGEATLNGKVNPNGFSTGYHFEWGTQAEYEKGEYKNRVPASDLNIGSGKADVAVKQTIKGLKDQATYHYRLVAENPQGKTIGADKSFSTPNWAPAITLEEAIVDGREEVDLYAKINPNGFKSTYHFEWGEGFEELNHSIPIPDAEIGSGKTDVVVSQRVEGLDPDTTYYFRVVAKNAEGTSTSYVDTFLTHSESGFGAYGYPAFLTGSATAFQMNISLFSFQCEGPSIGGEILSPVGVLTAKASGQQSCSGNGAKSLAMNGCKFVFHPREVSGGEVEGVADIRPRGCGPIVFKWQSFAYECTYEFASQGGFPVDFTNKGGTVEASMYATAAFTATGSLLYCGSSGSLTWYGAWLISAKSEAGESVPFSLASEVPEPPPYTLRIAAGGYPASLSGEQDPSNRLALEIDANNTLECEGASLDSALSEASSELPLEAEYGGCTTKTPFGSRLTTVDVNSCHYLLDVLSTSPPAGAMGVACGKEGDAIEIKTYLSKAKEEEGKPQCTYEIGAQGAPEGVGLQTVGGPYERRLQLDLEQGLTYTRTQGTLLCGAAGGTAEYRGSATLQGTSEEAPVGVYLVAE